MRSIGGGIVEGVVDTNVVENMCNWKVQVLKSEGRGWGKKGLRPLVRA
jgi:hypothetical protein